MTDPFTPPEQPRLAVIGLGYVGLPLAAEFGRHLDVVGFDVNAARVAELRAGRDSTREVEPAELAAATGLTVTDDPAALADCNTFIVTVPTPVDEYKTPDLTPLIRASETVGPRLAAGDVVIYESTVYPGATEEACIPVLERTSGLTYNQDLFAGYSPERINPGDKEHRFTTITKVTAGSTPAVADYVDGLYASVVTAGTHKASSIAVAEAAKVIENTQRDVNIALVNELAIIFNRLGIDTEEVLKAAGTKWNFLPFRPGLVGGHCIGVDPYYLTHKAQAIGHHPEMVLAGRRINDGMGPYIADRLVKRMVKTGFPVVGSRVLVMGLTFKENCPDLRNTRVVDIIEDLTDYNAQVTVWDPWVDPQEAEHEYGITPETTVPAPGTFDAIVLAVPHREFLEMGPEAIRELGRENAVLFDVKSTLPAGSATLRL
ncbi:UDP-N-acetyl-D-galactosamine dehydrogenase [Thiohalospira halophila DSM 15071]|uniref:UDP-N-acetyl-D-galactosamine dehydrogenase n=1 Tax=Thiohalospira halophila DSM 15071 TaxID=1123397 RepID=A0A1I1NEQ8_9GAMM|nr:Vi polysaccharide biosynthesis UDP-N-acetylglucosamine C-6 dehydrogenase TviB [Thiohalospira halophila]SFC96099.1 UDP-N-acetyl-D-galactosamine dehydrogenase [Thiohalospira halophila DSM 15071]